MKMISVYNDAANNALKPEKGLLQSHVDDQNAGVLWQKV